MKISDLQEDLRTIEVAEKSARLYSGRIVFYRFAAFCLFIVFTAAGYDYSPLFYGAAVGMGLLFLRLLCLHRQIANRLNRLASRRAVLRQYLARFDGHWRRFPENGERFLQEEEPQGRDLDLFGPGSVYQFICAARTALGRAKLAAALSPSPPPLSLIEQRQEAAAEFIAGPKCSLALESLLQLLPESHDPTPLLVGLAGSDDAVTRALKIPAYTLPLLTIASVLLAAAGSIGSEVPLVFLFLQFTLSGLLFSRSGTALAPLFGFYRALRPYEELFALLEKQPFQAHYLRQLQKDLHGAGTAIGQLRRIGEYANMRRNVFFYFAANTLLLWDFHCILHLTRWKAAHGKKVPAWLETFATAEMLLSLAVIGHIKAKHCFPVIQPAIKPQLTATDIAHVLLDENKSVANSLAAAAGTTFILTGSNMSGKTTFLRTLATSAILAYAGAPVCAKTFTLSRMHIFTSMRVQDDISRGLSTFYAELLRIKSMVEYSRRELPMLILIDEIFKGTNSADRIIGAEETIRKLTRTWSLTFVSTHDFELCDLEHTLAGIQNYHFTEFYENDEIHFDYKLKTGRCQTTNARYLLKMAGIL